MQHLEHYNTVLRLLSSDTNLWSHPRHPHELCPSNWDEYLFCAPHRLFVFLLPAVRRHPEHSAGWVKLSCIQEISIPDSSISSSPETQASSSFKLPGFFITHSQGQGPWWWLCSPGMGWRILPTPHQLHSWQGASQLFPMILLMLTFPEHGRMERSSAG